MINFKEMSFNILKYLFMYLFSGQGFIQHGLILNGGPPVSVLPAQHACLVCRKSWFGSLAPHKTVCGGAHLEL